MILTVPNIGVYFSEFSSSPDTIRGVGEDGDVLVGVFCRESFQCGYHAGLDLQH